MSALKITMGILYVVVILFADTLNGNPSFLGGTMTFTLEDNPNGTVTAHMQVLAGWQRGTGPCGRNCSRLDTNHQTHRQLMESTVANSSLFGTFMKNNVGLNKEERNSFNETIISVNEQLGWEQEVMTFHVELQSKADKEKVIYKGQSWKTFTLQGQNISWQFTTSINTNIRNDTQKRNRSPKIKLNPYYRIDFDQTSFIDVPVVDDDDDRIQCEFNKDSPSMLEIGKLNKVPAPGITVFENCTVKINASSKNNYTGDDWIAVTVEVKDINKFPLLLGSTVIAPSKAALSKLQIQFAVHVDKNLLAPVFVQPTPEPLQEFIIYAGATWSIDVFAESHNGTVTEYVATGSMDDTWIISSVQPDSKSRQNIVQATIKSASVMNQTEQKIACVSAVNTHGVESLEQRCFRLVVKGKRFNYTTPTVNDVPMFVQVPYPNETVKCPIDSTCILPIYVKSSRNSVQIKSSRSFMEYTDVLKPVRNTTLNGDNVFATDLVVRHSISGKFLVCIQANDNNGAQSEELCFSFYVSSPDPCTSGPCQTGECQFREEIGTFTCNCPTGLTGKLCDTKIDYCNPNPCTHGMCVSSVLSYKCYCNDDKGKTNDYTGTTCSERINDCPPVNACNNNGICEDGFKNYTCHCFGGFSGANCTIDLCDNPATNQSCSNDGCPDRFCQDHGVCENGKCYCMMGFNGRNCETDIQPSTTKDTNREVTILDPTLTNGSMIQCHDNHDCIFDVYFTSRTGIRDIKVSNQSSAGLAQNIQCSAFLNSTIPYGHLTLYVMRCYLTVDQTLTGDHYSCVKVSANEHSYDTVCYEIYIESGHARKKRSTTLFLPPTPSPDSIVRLEINKPHTLTVYTSLYGNQTCGIMKSTSVNVHVMPTHKVSSFEGQVCLTLIIASFDKPSDTPVCLNYGHGQDLCLKFVVVGGNITDMCAPENNRCQNGVCFSTKETRSKCICDDNYFGEDCERGPCQNANTCDNDGHCFVNNHTQTCVCKPGYYGDHCSTRIGGRNSSEHQAPLIVRTSGVTRTILCAISRKCEVYLMTQYTSESSSVALGFVSKAIEVIDLAKNIEESLIAVYQVVVQFIARNKGEHVLCVQTLTQDRTSTDELCFKIKVDAAAENLVYGHDDRPYFISPSLQSNSEIECEIGGQCHVSYTATSGKGSDFKCLSASLSVQGNVSTLRPFEHVIYSSCDKCVENGSRNTDCTFEVMLVPKADNIQHVPCLTLFWKGTPQEKGETRCFNISKMISAPVASCRNLTCLNRGFCDGHDVDKPVCFCRKGYFGQTCGTSNASTNNNACIKQFLGKNSLNFTCKVGETCSFPVEVCGANSMTMELAYDAALIDVTMDTDSILGGDSCCEFRKVHVKANTVGTRMFCVQMSNSSGTIEDEVCPHVEIYVSDDSPENIDKAKPHFVPPTLPKTTTFVCKVREVCHLMMYFVESDVAKTTSCPALKDTSQNEIEGLHVFQPEYSNDYCVSDVSFNYDSTGTFSLCLQVLVTSKKGEERCFQIQVVEDSIFPKETGLCKGSTCFGKGVCVAHFNNNTQTCSCPEDFKGHDCSIEITSPEHPPTTKGTTTKTVVNDPNVPVGSATAVNEAAKPWGSTETNTVSSSGEEPPKAGGSVATTAGIGAGGLAGVSVVGVAIFKIISMKKRQSNKVEDEA